MSELKVKQLTSEIRSGACALDNLTEWPGYNGSLLQIDDIESARIAKSMYSAADTIESMQAQIEQFKQQVESLKAELKKQAELRQDRNDWRARAEAWSRQPADALAPAGGRND